MSAGERASGASRRPWCPRGRNLGRCLQGCRRSAYFGFGTGKALGGLGVFAMGSDSEHKELLFFFNQFNNFQIQIFSGFSGVPIVLFLMLLAVDVFSPRSALVPAKRWGLLAATTAACASFPGHVDRVRGGTAGAKRKPRCILPAQYRWDFNGFGCPPLAVPMNEDAPPDLHSPGQSKRLPVGAEGDTRPSWSGHPKSQPDFVPPFE